MIRARISSSETPAAEKVPRNLAVAKNADPVGDAPHLRQTVRDVNDRRSEQP